MAYRSISSRERARQRRRSLGRFLLALLVLGALGGLGWAAYETGTQLALSRVTDLERRQRDLAQRLETSTSIAAGLRLETDEAKRALQALQARYDRDVPRGEMAELMEAMRERTSQNVPAARLLQVMRETTPLKACEGRVIRRRMQIAPAGRTGEELGLLEGLVQVSANGPGSDIAKTTSVTVGRSWAPEPLRAQGLPARFDIAINNLGLKLTVEPSEVSGFVNVSLGVCGKG